jgi:small subunit ribosomal protein S1
VGDISAEKRINHPQDVLKTGQAVRAAVLEVDREKRRIRLGLKQLQPTSIDEYIAEHKAGDLVSGRVANIARGKATVELGEGIQASCNIEVAEANVAAAGAEPGKREPARAGQIRSFRIVRLDPGQKKIELELAS